MRRTKYNIPANPEDIDFTSLPAPHDQYISDEVLSRKEELFCQAFICHLNQTQAAKEAGYPTSLAAAHGSEVVRRPRVKARIQHLMKQRAKRLKITQDRVLCYMSDIAFVDIREMFDEQGRFKGLANLTKEQAAVIKSIKVKQLKQWKQGKAGRPPEEVLREGHIVGDDYPGGQHPGDDYPGGQHGGVDTGGASFAQPSEIVEVQFYDRQSALELLGRHAGLFDHRFKVDINETKKLQLEINWEKALDHLSSNELEQLLGLIKKLPQDVIDMGNEGNGEYKALPPP